MAAGRPAGGVRRPAGAEPTGAAPPLVTPEVAPGTGHAPRSGRAAPRRSHTERRTAPATGHAPRSGRAAPRRSHTERRTAPATGHAPRSGLRQPRPDDL